MEEKTSQVVETVSKIPTSKKVLIGVAVGAIVTGVAVLAVKRRKGKETSETETSTEA